MGDIRPKKKLLKEVLPNTRSRASEPSRSAKDPLLEPSRRSPREASLFRQPLVAVILVAFLFLAVTVFDSMAHATITITPQSETVSLENESFAASRTAQDKTVLFQVMKTEREEEHRIAATGTETVQERARGQVVLYNAYSASPQRLLIETRLESPSGKIYKTTAPVTIPGYTKKGNEVIPGSVEVSVFADAPGEAYNEGLTDFTLIGFKGRPQYEKIYARSKTALSGGFSGTRGVVSAEDRTKAEATLKESLQDTLLSAARLEAPESFVIYDDAAFFSTSTTERTDGNDVVITMKGTLTLVILEKESLVREIARAGTTTATTAARKIPDIEALSFSFENRSAVSPETVSTFSFALDGDATLVRVVDEASLKADVRGAKKKDLGGIFSAHDAILSTHTSISPFWKSALPEKEEAIKLEYAGEE